MSGRELAAMSSMSEAIMDVRTSIHPKIMGMFAPFTAHLWCPALVTGYCRTDRRNSTSPVQWST